MTRFTSSLIFTLLVAMLTMGCATVGQSIKDIEAEQELLTKTEATALEKAQKAQERRKVLQGEKKGIYQTKAAEKAALVKVLKEQAEAAEKAQQDLEEKAAAIPEDVPEVAVVSEPEPVSKGYIQVTVEDGGITRDPNTPYPADWDLVTEDGFAFLKVDGKKTQVLMLSLPGCFRITPTSSGPCASE